VSKGSLRHTREKNCGFDDDYIFGIVGGFESDYLFGTLKNFGE